MISKGKSGRINVNNNCFMVCLHTWTFKAVSENRDDDNLHKNLYAALILIFIHNVYIFDFLKEGKVLVVGIFYQSHCCVPTWKLFISFHPSDDSSRLTAHGSAGHLCLVALAQDLIPGLDDGVTWRNYDMAHKQSSVSTEAMQDALKSAS